MKLKSNIQINQLQHEGMMITNELKIANTFNKFFIEIGSKLDSEIPSNNSQYNIEKFLNDRRLNSLTFKHTSPEEIIDITEALDHPISIIKISKHLISKRLSLYT